MSKSIDSAVPIENVFSVMILNHDMELGKTVANSFGVPISLPLKSTLTVGEPILVSISANDIALSLHYIDGISIQNQIKGRICAIIFRKESVIVQVDCGETLLVEITFGAYKSMNIKENDVIYCLIKTHSIAYVH